MDESRYLAVLQAVVFQTRLFSGPRGWMELHQKPLLCSARRLAVLRVKLLCLP